MKRSILFIVAALLVACSPRTADAMHMPVSSATVAPPTKESPAATMAPTQGELLPTVTVIPSQPTLMPTVDPMTLIPGATSTVSGLVPTELSVTANPAMSRIMASFSSGPHGASMQCERCHTMEAGLVTKKLTWVDDSTGLAEPIKEPIQVCLKCHDYLSMESLVMLAHPGFECTHCHDAHHPQPTCAASACH